MLIDTHTHLLAKYYEQPLAEVESFRAAGVDCVINVGFDYQSSQQTTELAMSSPYVFAAVGIHPHSAETVTDHTLDQLAQLAKNSRVVALGEIGLDYHYETPERQVQVQAFVRQLELADSLKLPIIVHSRDAAQQMLEIVAKRKNIYGGVFHCFSGSAETARELVKLGYHISFSGSVTFKNAAKLAEAVLAVPDDRLLVETDCPYLAPAPHRGKTNYPAFVRLVAERVAEIRTVSTAAIENLTAANAIRLFGLARLGVEL